MSLPLVFVVMATEIVLMKISCNGMVMLVSITITLSVHNTNFMFVCVFVCLFYSGRCNEPHCRNSTAGALHR